MKKLMALICFGMMHVVSASQQPRSLQEIDGEIAKEESILRFVINELNIDNYKNNIPTLCDNLVKLSEERRRAGHVPAKKDEKAFGNGFAKGFLYKKSKN